MTFQVHLAQDIGDLFKVRLGFADILSYKTLHIARVCCGIISDSNILQLDAIV